MPNVAPPETQSSRFHVCDAAEKASGRCSWDRAALNRSRRAYLSQAGCPDAGCLSLSTLPIKTKSGVSTLQALDHVSSSWVQFVTQTSMKWYPITRIQRLGSCVLVIKSGEIVPSRGARPTLPTWNSRGQSPAVGLRTVNIGRASNGQYNVVTPYASRPMLSRLLDRHS